MCGKIRGRLPVLLLSLLWWRLPGQKEQLELSAELLPVSMVRNGRTLSGEEAEAIRIVKNGAEYVVIVCHQELISEVDIFTAGGYESYGKLMVFTPECAEGGGPSVLVGVWIGSGKAGR